MGIVMGFGHVEWFHATDKVLMGVSGVAVGFDGVVGHGVLTCVCQRFLGGLSQNGWLLILVQV